MNKLKLPFWTFVKVQQLGKKKIATFFCNRKFYDIDTKHLPYCNIIPITQLELNETEIETVSRELFNYLTRNIE